ncbi:MAG: phytoene desaturase [Flavobacteriales bacterium]|nr:phytoene desaturase [Flavobacteriales bacterium]
MSRKVAVIGSGFAGLSAAATLAKVGYDVTVYEKNATSGGRAMKFETDGFLFDMGPSWYWMPEVFEEFYQQFGTTTSDFYQLDRLDPSYRVYFGKDDFIDVPAGVEEFHRLVESLELGGSEKLKIFLKEAEYKYRLSMEKFIRKPALSFLEFMDPTLIPAIFKLHLFQSISTHIRKRFRNPRLIQILEFPVIFLGAKPSETPALYSMMNHADIALGTWYPQGGMNKVIAAFETICVREGVKFEYNSSVERINVENGIANGIRVNGTDHSADIVLGTADYHHIDQVLLEEKYQSYSKEYWDTRKMSPSCLIFYIGLNKKVSNMLHHTLFFDRDMDKHMNEIFDKKRWPTEPLLYVSCPSKTDATVAPEGCENLYVLIPVSVGLVDDQKTRDHYFDLAMKRIEHVTGQEIKKHVVFKRSYAHSDYQKDHNGFKGNAFGLANTLKQTAIFKPSLRSNRVKNLFFAGQLTTPGPGVPPCIISGQVAAIEIQRTERSKKGV